jgi:hypothetical protein
MTSDIRSDSDVAQQVTAKAAQGVDPMPAQQQSDEETHAGTVRAVIVP